MKRILSILILTALSISSAMAIEVDWPFGDGMILAKDQPIRIHGKGEGTITVRMAGKKAKVSAKDGRWTATLPAMKAGGPYVMEISEGETSISFKDVHVGTVLIVSGQSNMQFKLSESDTPEECYVDDPLLRFFSTPRIEKGEPFTPADGWVACTAGNAGRWSAIGYLVGREIREKSGEAVGIINCYQGASIIEAWIPKETVARPEFQLPEESLHFDHRYEVYQAWNQPGLLYDLDIVPIAPYGISHVVWYQGESNTGNGEAAIYPQLAVEMVKAWRKVLNVKRLPFVMIQIANYLPRNDDAWKNLQEAQMKIPSLIKGVKVVPCADVCQDDNIHPRTKTGISHRVVEAIF
ncbi:MAG: hypothetical protein MJY86_01020 [Bacteroidales bacterium]|nr:hypothetical protein [Bacteroidales bacterium]